MDSAVPCDMFFEEQAAIPASPHRRQLLQQPAATNVWCNLRMWKEMVLGWWLFFTMDLRTYIFFEPLARSSIKYHLRNSLLGGLFCGLWMGSWMWSHFSAEYFLGLFPSYSLTSLIKTCRCFLEGYDPDRSLEDCGKSATDTTKVGLQPKPILSTLPKRRRGSFCNDIKIHSL